MVELAEKNLYQIGAEADLANSFSDLVDLAQPLKPAASPERNRDLIARFKERQFDGSLDRMVEEAVLSSPSAFPDPELAREISAIQKEVLESILEEAA